MCDAAYMGHAFGLAPFSPVHAFILTLYLLLCLPFPSAATRWPPWMRSSRKETPVSCLRFFPPLTSVVSLPLGFCWICSLLKSILFFLCGYHHQIPCVLAVDRKTLFDAAAQKLGFYVQAENTLTIRDEFVTVIKVANLPARASFQKETKEFYGEFASTDALSVQNAYHVALRYLEKEGIIVVNDYNSEYIMQLKSDLFRFKSWAMLHEFDAASVRKRTREIGVALRGLLSAMKVPLGSPHSAQSSRPSKKTRRCAEDSPASSSVSVSEHPDLPGCLAKLEATMACLLDGPLEKNGSVPRQIKQEGTSSSTLMY